MFRGKSKPEPQKRFITQHWDYSAVKSVQKRAENIEDALNRGDDMGWKLVQVMPSGWNGRGDIIIWDTEPQ